MSNLNRLKAQWELRFQNKVEEISKYLDESSATYPEEAEFKKLANWIFSNEIPPYQYLSQYCLFEMDIGQAHALLSLMRHAMLDDGAMCFVYVSIDGALRRIYLSFTDPYDENVGTIWLSENENIIPSLRLPQLEGIADSASSVVTFSTHNDPVKFMADVKTLHEEGLKRMKDLYAKFDFPLDPKIDLKN